MTTHPRALALLVVLAGLLVPASPAFAVGTPTITTPATTPSYTTNQVDLSWTAASGAISYSIFRGATCLGATPVAIGLVVTTFSETPADSSYCYFVEATDGMVVSDSTPVTIVRDAVAPAGAWTSPSAGAYLTGSGTLTLAVSPSDATSGVDTVAFEIEGNTVVVRRASPLDKEYAKAVEGTLSEWLSAEDEEAYRGL